MITSLFRKSSPINYALTVLLLLVFYFMYQIRDLNWIDSMQSIGAKIGIMCLLLGSIFTSNFIVKKNGLTKNSSYPILFYFLFLLLFPPLFNNVNIVFANFFVLLALRRLISLHSLKTPREKIFDASLWIFIATLFHFWCILFIILVFISVFFHVSKDYRNWFLPILALAAVYSLFTVIDLITNASLIDHVIASSEMNYDITYFENQYQNIAFSIYVTIILYFLVLFSSIFSGLPMVLHSSFKKITLAFIIGVVIFLISIHKSNDLLTFTFAPLAIMATVVIETTEDNFKQEFILFVLVACSLLTYFTQL